jgi:hypothetical protein
VDTQEGISGESNASHMTSSAAAAPSGQQRESSSQEQGVQQAASAGGGRQGTKHALSGEPLQGTGGLQGLGGSHPGVPGAPARRPRTRRRPRHSWRMEEAADSDVQGDGQQSGMVRANPCYSLTAYPLLNPC